MWTNPISPTVDRLKTALLAVFGGTTGGLSVFGAVHGVCHAACQGLVAAAALAGISLVGMPLAFLLDPRWTLGFGAMGVASAAWGLYLRLRMRRALSKGVVWFGLVGLISLTTLGTSLWQMADAASPSAGGVVTVVLSRIELDAPKKTDRVGTVAAEMEYLGIDNGVVRFRLALNTDDMAAPPLDANRVATTAYLEVSNRRVGVSTWTIQDTGHMGHHLRAVMAFRLDAALATALTKAQRIELGFATAGDSGYHRFDWKVRRSQP